MATHCEKIEKMGIAEALAMATHRVETTARSPNHADEMVPVGEAKYDKAVVRLFVDAQTTLHQIRSGVKAEWTDCLDRDCTRPIDLVIVSLSERLRARGCTVELHWMPRNRAPEHRLADILSRGACVGDYQGKEIRLAERSQETRDLDDEVTKAVESWFFKQHMMALRL